jgi:hypothetical protein
MARTTRDFRTAFFRPNAPALFLEPEMNFFLKPESSPAWEKGLGEPPNFPV